MSKNLITNSGRTDEKNRRLELIRRRLGLLLLVCFSFFSGVPELHNELQTNYKPSIKFLIGLNFDSGNHDLIEYFEKINPRNDEGLS